MLRISTSSLRLKRVTAASTLNGLRDNLNLLLSPKNQTVRFQSTEPATEPEKSKGGLFNKIFGLDSNVASESFKARWAMAVPAFATHMAIGSTWGWSIMADVVTRENGFVTSAASDWTLMESAFPISIVFLVLGLSASVAGKWQIKVGARHAIAVSALTFGGGLAAGAAGIHMHSLPLLYVGYGCMAGTGLGLAYTPPVQTLMQWFPDKKGIAAGLPIAGFGSGALVFAPAVQYLMKHFATMPEYLGPLGQYATTFQSGKLLADVNGTMVEVVQAGAAELAKIPYTLSEGLYVVGTGSTGAAEALAVMGGVYFAMLMGSALTLKKPHPSFVAPKPIVKEGGFVAPVPAREISLDEAMRTKQFYLLGTAFYCLATGGIGVFSVAKPMMSEVFSTALPAVVTSAFAAKYILMLSAGNLGGRLGWAALSDAIGRRKTLTIFTAGSIPLYLFLPSLVDSVVSTGSSLPLYGFCVNTALAISMMGGVYAILPAYEADLFGTRFAGAVHGRMLLFSSAAALSGPTLLLSLRAMAEKAAVTDLLTKVSPEKFQAVFGAPIESAMELLQSKALTIGKLLVLCPPGTVDPTPHLYDTTMYALSGMMALAFVAQSMVKPLTHPSVTDIAAVAKGETTVIDATGTVVSESTEKKMEEEKVGDRQIK